MLIIIYVRRILEKPLAVVDRHRNDAVVAACRVIQSSCVALILAAKQAFRIGGLLCKLCSCDCLRILLRLGKVDRDIQITVFGRRDPFAVLRDAVAADVIGILAHFVVEIGCLFRAFLIKCLEFPDDIGRTVYEKRHHLRIKQVAVANGIFFQNAVFVSVVTDFSKNTLQLPDYLAAARHIVSHCLLCIRIKGIYFQKLQHLVCCIAGILFFDQAGLQTVLDQFCNAVLNHLSILPYIVSLLSSTVSITLCETVTLS